MGVLSVFSGGSMRPTSDQNMLLFESIYGRIQRELLPSFRVVRKEDVAIHRFFNWVLNLFYPASLKDGYLELCSTTLAYKAALARATERKPGVFWDWMTLCHEATHGLQARRYSPALFLFLYLWPLSQGLLIFLLIGLPFIWATGWILGAWLLGWFVIAGLHFIPQWPDPYRTRFELEAYFVSLHLEYMVFGKLSWERVDSIASQFHSMAYFMMEPRQARIKRKIRTAVVAICRNQSPVKDHPIIKIAEEEYRRFVPCPKTQSCESV